MENKMMSHHITDFITNCLKVTNDLNQNILQFFIKKQQFSLKIFTSMSSRETN